MRCNNICIPPHLLQVNERQFRLTYFVPYANKCVCPVDQSLFHIASASSADEKISTTNQGSQYRIDDDLTLKLRRG